MKTTRREFLAAAAAAPIVSPILLGMQDKAGTKTPVMGQGAYTYEAAHDWGTLPSSIKYGNTHGVVQDSQGRIYVHHTVYADSETPDSMVVFDESGRFVRSWAGNSAASRTASISARKGATSSSTSRSTPRIPG